MTDLKKAKKLNYAEITLSTCVHTTTSATTAPSSSEESDYLDNLRLHPKARSPAKKSKSRRKSIKPVIKVEMDLERNQLSVVTPMNGQSKSHLIYETSAIMQKEMPFLAVKK